MPDEIRPRSPLPFPGDLAIERHRASPAKEGVRYCEETHGALRLCALTVLDEAAAGIGKACGRYLSVECSASPLGEIAADELRAVLVDALCFFLGTRPLRLLVAGLGNRRLTADAFGPLAADGVEATAAIPDAAVRAFGLAASSRVSVCIPDVLARTGVESTRHVAAVAALTRAEAVLAVDSLATAERTRLLSVVELSDTGTVPGGGVGARPLPLSEKTLGIPVVSVGIPTVVRSGDAYFTVSRTIEEDTAILARVTAEAINLFAHAPSPPAPDPISELFSKEEL